MHRLTYTYVCLCGDSTGLISNVIGKRKFWGERLQSKIMYIFICVYTCMSVHICVHMYVHIDTKGNFPNLGNSARVEAKGKSTGTCQ